MMKIGRFECVLACIALLVGCTHAADIKSFKIATGSKDLSYHAVGKALAKLSESDDYPNLEIIAEPSRGSIDNLIKLLDPDSGYDLALVQSDLLVRILDGEKFEGLPPDTIGRMKSLKGVAAIMPEYIQIVVRAEPDDPAKPHENPPAGGYLISSNQLIGKKLYRGGATSGSRHNAIDLVEFLGAPRTIEWADKVESFKAAADLLKQGSPELDAAFLTSNKLVTEGEEGRGLRLLPVVGVEKFVKNQKFLGLETMDKISLPYTRAVLITRKEHEGSPAMRAMTKMIVEDLMGGLHQPDGDGAVAPTVFKEDQLSRGTVLPLAKAAKKFYREKHYLTDANLLCLWFVIACLVTVGAWCLFLGVGSGVVTDIAVGLWRRARGFCQRFGPSLRRIPRIGKWFDRSGRFWRWMVRTFLKACRKADESKAMLAASVLIVSGIAAHFIFNHYYGNPIYSLAIGLLATLLVALAYFVIKNIGSALTLVTVLLTVLTMALLFGWIVLLTEDMYSTRNGNVNRFAQMENAEFLVWLGTFGLTGYHGDLFPHHILGKIAAGSLPLGGIILLLFTIYRAAIERSKRHERYELGLDAPKLRDHVIIGGWNDRVPMLVEQLSESSAGFGEETRVIVIAEFEDEKPLAKYLFRKGFAFAIKGLSSDSDMLVKASIDHAKAVLIVADPRKVKNKNQRGVLTAAAVKKHFDSPQRSGRRPQVISELFYGENEADFRLHGGDHILPIRKISTQLIVHATIHPGSSRLAYEILSSSRPQRIERCTAAAYEGESVQNRGLKAAFKEMHHEGRLLLGIHRKVNGENGKQVSKYITCVGDDQIQATDELIYLAKNPKYHSLVVDGCEWSDDQTWGRQFRIPRADDDDESELETVMVVASEADASGVISELSQVAGSVVHLSPAALADDQPHIGEPVTHGNYCRIPVREIDDLTLDTALAAARKQMGLKDLAFTRVVVFGPDRESVIGQTPVQQDEPTMRCIQEIKAFFHERHEFAAGRDPDAVYLVAELRSENNRTLFDALGVNQPIRTDAMISLFEHAILFHHGIVTGLLLDLLGVGEDAGSGLCTGRLERVSMDRLKALNRDLYDEVVESNFSEALERLIKSKLGWRLLAIVADDRAEDPASDEAGGTTEAGNGTASAKRWREMIVNPLKGDPHYKRDLSKKDFLFVLKESVATERGVGDRRGIGSDPEPAAPKPARRKSPAKRPKKKKAPKKKYATTRSAAAKKATTKRTAKKKAPRRRK